MCPAGSGFKILDVGLRNEIASHTQYVSFGPSHELGQKILVIVGWRRNDDVTRCAAIGCWMSKVETEICLLRLQYPSYFGILQATCSRYRRSEGTSRPGGFSRPVETAAQPDPNVP